VNKQGHVLHLATRKALEIKNLVVYVVGANYYDLTELGATEARRLQAEQQARSDSRHHRKVTGKPSATSRSIPQCHRP